MRLLIKKKSYEQRFKDIILVIFGYRFCYMTQKKVLNHNGFVCEKWLKKYSRVYSYIHMCLFIPYHVDDLFNGKNARYVVVNTVCLYLYLQQRVNK